MGQKIFKLQERRLWGRGGSMRRVVMDWTGAHRYSRRHVAARSNPDHCIEDWPKIAIRATQRASATSRRFGSLLRSGMSGAAGRARLAQRRHSIATNSPRAELPVVTGSVPAISPRSTLRNDAASTKSRALQ
jgi:hypothetical protein